MRRSKSSSNIPLPTFKRHPSNENIGSSQEGPRTSHQGLRRSNSSKNLLSAKKQPLFLGDSRRESDIYHENVEPSASRNSYRRITATPLRSSTNDNVCRRIGATPRSHNKVPASPFILLTMNKINDKQFSSDQFRKICAFLESRKEDFDPKSLKPSSLSSFVQTISMLFREIDPRINIDMANYKEVVFKYLKLYKYPGPVTMSLLKSVNINSSWAQVMSIFGWLVDVINDLTIPNHEPLQEYLLCRVQKVFRLESETKGSCIEYIEELMNFDKTESEALEKKYEILKQEAENKRILINEQKEKECMLSEQLDQMKSDIREIKEGNLEIKIKNEVEELQSEYKIRVKKIEDLKQSIAQKQQTISNQKYSLEDKQKLLKKLEDEKYSLHLKKEELENVFKLKHEYDLQVTDFRRQVETGIHEINIRLLQLNLGHFVDDAKKIRLPDRGLHKPGFIEEIEEKKELLENIAKKINLECQEAKETISAEDLHLQQLSDDARKMNEELDLLKKKIENYNVEIDRLLFEFDVEKKQIEMKIAQSTKNVPDVESAKKRKLELQKEASDLKDKLNNLGEESIYICQQIYADTKEKAFRMRADMADLTLKAEKAYEAKVLRKAEIAKCFREN